MRRSQRHKLASILLFGTACFTLDSPAQMSNQTPGEVLFRLELAATKPAAALTETAGIDSVTPILTRGPRTKPTSTAAHIYKAILKQGASVSDAIAALESRSDVLYAQPNHLFETFQATNDPKLAGQFYLDLIRWPDLFAALPPKQKEVVVAVIDSGIDYRHEDLFAAIWINTAEAQGSPGFDDDGNGYVDDIRGWDFTDAPTLPGQGDFRTPDNDPIDESSHGTQVAGVIGATQNNGIGVAGVADCTLMAIRAGLTLDQGGTFLQEDDLAAGIIYAVDNGADILNLSWGSFDQAYVIEDAIRYAVEHGVIVIAAAGNTGTPPVSYPAALDDVISVSAVETTGNLASFSSYGHVLDLVAPGVNIVSTRLDNAYGPRSGSSFAAPQVSGLAALLLSRLPDMTPSQVRGALVASTTDLGSFGWDREFGSGQIDASRLTSYLAGTSAPTVRILAPGSDNEVSGVVSLAWSSSGEPFTSYNLSWGLDTDTPDWNLIETGAAQSGTSTSSWTVPASLLDQPIILRLEAITAGSSGTTEHRVRLRANPAIPAITSLFVGTIIAGNRPEWLVRWVTAAPTTGSLILRYDGGLTRDTIRTAKLDRFHEVKVPDQNTRRGYTFQIIARSPSGRAFVTPPEAFLLVPAKIPTIGFNEVANLPNGYLADRVSDFDGDNRQEITLMPYVKGQAFGPTQVFERDPLGAYTSVYTSTQSFLPWNIADVNHDGSPDLLGTSVARIELFSGPSLSTSLFDQGGLWGGDMADADGDGANEIIARSLVDHTIRIYKFGSTGFEQTASLVDFSSGSGEIGPHFVFADLDGDGKRDLLAGDGDGDLWIYEMQSGFFQPSVVIEGSDETDATIIGGGKDLDGDGKIEFVVARAREDDSDALNGWWDLEIYQSTSNNVYEREWVQRISGVAKPGNGISSGDLDGDGRADLAIALIPDLYVIKGDSADSYRPIYHTNISLTYRPILADLDGDGAAEFISNARDAVRLWERDHPIDAVQRPEILETTLLGRNRIRLTWMPSPGALTYWLLRSLEGGAETLLSDVPALTYLDEGVSPGQTYTYRVEAVLLEDGSVTSGPSVVTVSASPSVSGIDKIDDLRLAVTFTTPMSDLATDPNGYTLTPPGLTPNSAIRDQESRRILLNFSSPIADGITHTLNIRLATDLAGAQIDQAFRSVTFTPGATTSGTRADFDGDGRIGFGDFLLFAGAFGGNNPTFDLDDDNSVGFSDFLLFASLFGQSA